jgi:hypothetical protein
MFYLFANYIYNRDKADMNQTKIIIRWKQEVTN